VLILETRRAGARREGRSHRLHFAIDFTAQYGVIIANKSPR